MSVRDRVQASSGVSPPQSLRIEAVQVREVQLFMCEQVNAQLSHEVAYERVPVQVL